MKTLFEKMRANRAARERAETLKLQQRYVEYAGRRDVEMQCEVHRRDVDRQRQWVRELYGMTNRSGFPGALW